MAHGLILDRGKDARTFLASSPFAIQPYSLLDARCGSWQGRKRSWVATGIKGELGRGAAGTDLMTHGGTLAGNLWHGGKAESTLKVAAVSASGTSIFDPVLCECLYRWFCPPAGQIVDPFAGGSVRGIVASLLGRRYWGCDLALDQLIANEEQARSICPDNLPQWVWGDARDVLNNAPLADFVFSCPPYGNLEKYSDDPGDLSNMTWEGFLEAYRAIIRLATERLKPDRFAAFVVGDIRDPQGEYRDFVSLTGSFFRQAGLHLFNTAVLLTAVGSASMRVSKQFAAGRKFAKTHQDVLVFCNGDWERALAAVPLYNGG